MKRKMVTGDEYNALGRNRRIFVYLARAGAASKIKRGARRRERREAKQVIAQGRE